MSLPVAYHYHRLRVSLRQSGFIPHIEVNFIVLLFSLIGASKADSLTSFTRLCLHFPTPCVRESGGPQRSGRGKCVGLCSCSNFFQVLCNVPEGSESFKDSDPDLRGVSVCGSALLQDPVERRAKAGLILCRLPVKHRRCHQGQDLKSPWTHTQKHTCVVSAPE